MESEELKGSGGGVALLLRGTHEHHVQPQLRRAVSGSHILCLVHSELDLGAQPGFQVRAHMWAQPQPGFQVCRHRHQWQRPITWHCATTAGAGGRRMEEGGHTPGWPQTIQLWPSSPAGSIAAWG